MESLKPFMLDISFNSLLPMTINEFRNIYSKSSTESLSGDLFVLSLDFNNFPKYKF